MSINPTFFQKISKINIIFLSGQGLVAASSSIPSKFQTIVTDNSEQKGFGSASKRFQYEDLVVSITKFNVTVIV